jgi:2-polyprenyl-3-methyl-5-hydroxy-6-metoxy-1,4-benzoquinol methylase
MDTHPDPHEFTRAAWEANAEIWDARMGDEGNDFFNLLCWPALLSLLDIRPDRRYLDIACGNGLTSRRLAALGAQVTAFDFSSNPIEKAKARENPASLKVGIIIQVTSLRDLYDDSRVRWIFSSRIICGGPH